jgi:hypothetical protein
MASLATPEKFGNFDLVKSFKLGFTDVHVSKWRSRVTGLSVVHLDYEGTWLASHYYMYTFLTVSQLRL